MEGKSLELANAVAESFPRHHFSEYTQAIKMERIDRGDTWIEKCYLQI